MKKNKYIDIADIDLDADFPVKDGRTKVINIKWESHFDVYIGRGSPFGNPFVIGRDGTREEVIEKYRPWLKNRLKDPSFREAILKLKGRTLGCFCKPEVCHGDIIVEWLENSKI